jgi:hypothetical protein
MQDSAQMIAQRATLTIITKVGTKSYLPASTRIALFRAQYPEGVLEADVVFIDEAGHQAIVKAVAITNSGKGTGLMSGPITQIDQITKLAKALAIADLGIGTQDGLLPGEDDLEFAGVEVVAAASVPPASQEPEASSPNGYELDAAIRARLNDLYPRAKKLGLCASDTAFLEYIRKTVNAPQLVLKDVTVDHLSHVEADLHDKEQQGMTHRPARTLATVQAFYWKTFQVKPLDQRAKWEGFKKQVLKRTVRDNALTDGDLNTLNAEISQEYQSRQARKSERQMVAAVPAGKQ